MFDELIINLGNHKEGDKVSPEFHYSNIDRIDKFEHCSCMRVYPNNRTKDSS